jgi:hypothetical protein
VWSPLVKEPERFDRSGAFFCNVYFIFCHVTEAKQKKTPVSRSALRVADARRGTMGKKKT